MDPLIEKTIRRCEPRAGSLIVTVIGDVVSPHGNQVWLGSLIAALEPFGLNQRQIRTAVSRLVADGWLRSEQVGRRSYYGFSDLGLREFAGAARRIYRPPGIVDWDGRWTLVMNGGCDADSFNELARHLAWQGFAKLTTGLLGHPCFSSEAVKESVVNEPAVVVWRASSDSDRALSTKLRAAWDLDALDSGFRSFTKMFGPLSKWVGEKQLDGANAFAIRLMLVHEYRRLVLKSIELPRSLIPKGASNLESYKLASDLYQAVSDASLEYIRAHLTAIDGPLGAPDPAYFKRFDGFSVPLAGAA
ncbi:MAG: PaaX family transcriptional regulator C-terminal domain-containing protein [Pseudomonadota bacterium]